MSFAGIGLVLSQLISVSDQQAVFWKAFLQAFIDHNGGPEELDALLKDATNGRHWFNELAKKVIGGVWNFAESLVDLGAIDFNCSFKDFAAQYPSVSIVHGAREDYSLRWTGAAPHGPCKYRLIHFGKPMSFNRILEYKLFTQSGVKIEYAGFRELVAYVATFRPEDLKGFTIVAPGSRMSSTTLQPSNNWEVHKTFPVGGEAGQMVDISWHGVRDGNEDRCEYGVNNFFLVRVYE